MSHNQNLSKLPTFAGWWFGTFFIFHIFPFHIWDVILPIDIQSIIFQRGRSTTKQFGYGHQSSGSLESTFEDSHGV